MRPICHVGFCGPRLRSYSCARCGPRRLLASGPPGRRISRPSSRP